MPRSGLATHERWHSTLGPRRAIKRVLGNVVIGAMRNIRQRAIVGHLGDHAGNLKLRTRNRRRSNLAVLRVIIVPTRKLPWRQTHAPQVAAPPARRICPVLDDAGHRGHALDALAARLGPQRASKDTARIERDVNKAHGLGFRHSRTHFQIRNADCSTA